MVSFPLLTNKFECSTLADYYNNSEPVQNDYTDVGNYYDGGGGTWDDGGTTDWGGGDGGGFDGGGGDW